MELTSKLPEVGTTIFAVMSGLAVKHNAINLSQGFPDFDGDGYLKERVNHYINSGMNQYAPMPGVPRLNEAIAEKIKRHYGTEVDPQTEITVTSGATEALFAAIHALVRPGDEVIIFDPAYDSYAPAVKLAGGKPVHIPLVAPSFEIDWQRLSDELSDKTRAVMINSPHNPAGSILTRSDLDRLHELLESTDTYLISDEVYEHIIFDAEQHASVTAHEGLKKRSYVISSFGKTYHMTGWKIGYAVAPESMSREFRKVHQFLTFSTSTPMQHGIADMLIKKPEHADELPAFYQKKRDEFRAVMADTPFKLLPCKGTYFQLADYSAVSDKNDFDFCVELTERVGVAAIPLSPFYQSPPEGQRLIRFCFAKGTETFEAVREKLQQL